MAWLAMKRVRFTFKDHLIKQPIIYELGVQFHVVTNIRRADVQEGVGWVILELEGDEEDVERGLDWVRAQGVRVDRCWATC